MTSPPPTRRGGLAGALYAVGAYVIWGFLPLYFVVLAPTSPWEIVAWRILLSLVFCAILLTVRRSWGRLWGVVRERRLLAWTVVAGVLIYVNWQTYLISTVTGHVIEASLGYFINPLVTVLLGVLVLRERLRPMRWVAMGIAVAAIAVIVVGYGAVPWFALIIAFSFGLYGLVKKRIGPAVDAVSGLTLESLWLAPLALVQLVAVGMTTGVAFAAQGPALAVLLSLAGVVTAVPLLLFAAAARRVPLSLMGLLQFIAPIIQFAIGLWVLGEAMTTARWIGFGLVWVALVALSVDSVVAARGRAATRDVTDDVAEIV